MNSKNVLSKIMTLLSLDKEEILFTDAKLADGTILQSPTFDLGEDVEVVSEDGTKSKAPDGEHEIALKDSEGKEVVIRIITKDGKITERENVEEKETEAPEESESEIETEMQDEMPMDTMMAADYVKAPKGLQTDEAKSLPNTTSENEANVVKEGEPTEDPIIRLTYRITELEEAIAELKMKFGENKVEEVIEKVKEAKLEEVEVKKLDGAPIEMSSVNLSALHKSKKNNEGNYQSSFLSKLYN
jgi:hypothetical protein